jgi:hypothetical protein
MSTPTTERRTQPITGLTPPEIREALIRVAWPSVSAYPAVAALGRRLILTYLLAPAGWFLMLPFYFLKILPIIGVRYALTNKRVMIQRGWKRAVTSEIALRDIDEVRIDEQTRNHFFRSATIQLLHQGQVKVTLPAVKEPDVFYHAIRNACMAWVPEAAKKWLEFLPAKPREK